MIDGEGSIDIPSIKRGVKNGRYLHLRIRIGNTNFDALKYLKKVFGGKLRKQSWSKKSTKDRFSLLWSQNKAKDLLIKIFPILIIKKEQALLGLKFPISRREEDHKSHRLLTESEIDLRKSIRNSMIKLNGRRRHMKWIK